MKFPAQYLLSSLGNHDFWNLQSFLILKHYLNVKFGWSKCMQEIVLVHHFAVPFFPMQMCVQNFCNFLKFWNHYCNNRYQAWKGLVLERSGYLALVLLTRPPPPQRWMYASLTRPPPLQHWMYCMHPALRRGLSGQRDWLRMAH